MPATAWRRALVKPLWLVALLTTAMPGGAQTCGWARVDHVVPYDASGPWNPHIYRVGFVALSAINAGAAVWEGAETRLGKTMWQGVDAQLIAGVSSEVAKRVFSRVRPYQSNENPCLWFEGGSNKSFPSLESAASTALVMPYVLEYGAENPAAYAMLLLPLYVGAGRIKNQAHWQTDVAAGWAVGALSGWLAHSLETPFTIQLLPDGFAIGFKAQF